MTWSRPLADSQFPSPINRSTMLTLTLDPNELSSFSFSIKFKVNSYLQISTGTYEETNLQTDKKAEKRKQKRLRWLNPYKCCYVCFCTLRVMLKVSHQSATPSESPYIPLRSAARLITPPNSEVSHFPSRGHTPPPIPEQK